MNRTKTMLALVGAVLMSAVGLSAFAAPAVTVNSVTENGTWSTITVKYTLSGVDTSANYKMQFDVTAGGVTKTVTDASFARKSNTSYTKTIDTKTLFGSAHRDATAKVKVSLLDDQPDLSAGGQLWSGGPYWAGCNVGASNPEEYGYYFQWGNPVGYKWTGSAWVSAEDNTTFSFVSEVCETYDVSYSNLSKGGWIVSGKLVAEYDAARAYLGGDWRMPTEAEMQALVDKCDREWTTRNGVNGWLITGRGAYSSNGIFLPAAELGSVSYASSSHTHGYYWTSTPVSSVQRGSWDSVDLLFTSSSFSLGSLQRYRGASVRPVR